MGFKKKNFDIDCSGLFLNRPKLYIKTVLYYRLEIRVFCKAFQKYFLIVLVFAVGTSWKKIFKSFHLGYSTCFVFWIMI